MTKRCGCWVLKSKHMTGDSVGQIHSGYEGFFKLNRQTTPIVIELSKDTAIKKYLFLSTTHKLYCFNLIIIKILIIIFIIITINSHIIRIGNFIFKININ